jgi:hypothetical protein
VRPYRHPKFLLPLTKAIEAELNISPYITKTARFFGTAGCVVLGIKVDNHVLACEIFERDRIPGCVFEAKGRGGFSFFNRHRVVLLVDRCVRTPMLLSAFLVEENDQPANAGRLVSHILDSSAGRKSGA